MPKGVPGPTGSKPACRRAWLWFVVGAALLSVVFAQAQEPSPASTGDEARPRGEVERAAAENLARPPMINSLPLTRLAEKGRMMAEAGRLGYDTKLDLAATAELSEDGSLKPETVTFDWRETGDAEVVGLAQQFVAAVSESRLLATLAGDAKTVRLTARLDRQNVTLGMEAEVTSGAKATQWATGFGTLLLAARKTKAGTAEAPLYEALKTASDGKVFRLSFEMPKEAVAKMVTEMLDRQPRGAPPNRN